MPGLRISAISFLNTAPLMWDFEHGTAGQSFEIEYTIPSECAAALAANRADIGIIPAITYAQIEGLVILPNIAIASKDSVRSILLVSKKRNVGKYHQPLNLSVGDGWDDPNVRSVGRQGSRALRWDCVLDLEALACRAVLEVPHQRSCIQK